MASRRNVRRALAAVVATAVVATVGAVGAATPAGAAGGVRYRDLVFDAYTVDSDIVYGQSVNYLGVLEQHELDVLQPAGDTANDRAAVVWVHGGYFKRGDKTSYPDVLQQYVEAGYVVFSIDYRLNPSLPEGLLPTVETLRIPEYLQEIKDATHDAQAAVRWVRAHAAQYRVDPNKIAVSGHSAGGIVAENVGFNEDDPGTSGTPGVSSRVAAVVASAGATMPVLLAQVGLGEPPLFLSHGLSDDVVPYPADVPACVLTVLLGNVCEQQLDPDQAHPQFGYPAWRDFLYRRMIQPAAFQLPLQVTITGYPPLFP